MTLKEAEEFFKSYGGHHFHMWRDDPTNYSAYDKLDISDVTREKWRQELVDDYFDTMFDDPKNVWNKFFSAVYILKELEVNYQANFSRIIDSIRKMDYLDKQQKILIIDTVPDCCYYIFRYTNLAPALQKVMERFMGFECGPEDNLPERAWSNMADRYDKAVKNYIKSFEYYKSRVPYWESLEE